jgi:glycine cleavage system H protein
MEIQGYNMPENLYYHVEDAWVKVEAKEAVIVGMDDFYQKQAGDTTYVDLPFVGDQVKQGDTCGKIQSSKWVGKLVAPISGEILEVNSDLENDCRLINKDPYGAGWIMKIKPSNLDAELKNLANGQEAIKNFVESHLDKVKKGSK